MNSMHTAQRMTRNILILAGMIFVFAGAAVGQDAANGQATATVQTALTVTATQALDFGNLFPGNAKTIPVNDDDSAATFNIAGEANANVNCQLVLPTYMALPDGSDRMTIAFGDDVCGIDTTGTSTPDGLETDGGASEGYVDVNPRDMSSATLGGEIKIGGGAGNTQIFLGGKVTPKAAQAAGSYSADIILLVMYKGT
jgi:hypothetical protein